MPCRPAISSMSLGRAWVHEFPAKLSQAARYGFQGIELFHEDLERCDPENQVLAAHAIRSMCSERGLAIICLQPFLHYEGLKDREAHAQRLEKLQLWFQLATALKTDVIQIPSSFLPHDEITDDVDVIVADLREVADMGARQTPPIKFAYESLAWGTHVDTWEQCWDIVTRVDRPNFGACLDTFNIAGRIFADPASPSGMTANAEADTRASVERLVNTVDVAKVFFVQVVDAERLAEPLVEGHEFYSASQPARMSWSRNCRLFYGEMDRGGYLPVKEITKAFILGLGYDGWEGNGGLGKIVEDCGLQTPTTTQQTRRTVTDAGACLNSFPSLAMQAGVVGRG
ncbi:hypothetical protein H2203_000149 [Taxawa tesnikishii (nom. ined.)]|nr:hypothetical protein H2203_000149 [Dothideales sp. JES 119]